MVFAKNWDDFESAAETMYSRSPDSSRFTMKYTHQKGELVLKVTDNVKVSTYTVVLLLFTWGISVGILICGPYFVQDAESHWLILGNESND